MKTYLMMLYVSVEQELAVKDFFTDKGWGFRKPDLRMTTDEVGPLIEEHVQSEKTVHVVVQQEQPVEDNSRPRRAASNRQSKSSPVSKPASKVPRVICVAKKDNESHESSEFKDILEEAEMIAASPVSKPASKGPRVIRIAKKDKESDESSEFQDILEDAEMIAASLNQTSIESDYAAPVIKVEQDSDYDEEADDNDYDGEQSDNTELDATPSTSKLDDLADTSLDTSTSAIPSTAKKRKLASEGSSPDTTKTAVKTDTEADNSDSAVASPTEDVDKGDDGHITPYQTRFQCDLCKKIYATKYGAQRHLKSHEPGLVRCGDCHTYYRSREALEEHRTLRHPGPIPCDICGATFMRRSGLKFHIMKYHDESYQGKYHCSYEGCTRIFHREKALIEHTNRHMGIKPHMCEKCGKVFALSDSMFRHKKVCVENVKYKCVDCGKEYASSGSLSSHKSSAHLNKLHPCSCGRIFKHLSGLIKHKKTTGHPAINETPRMDDSYFDPIF